VLDALRAADGSVTEASARLGVHRTTLWRWMRGLGLRREDYRA
jgi:transcriptional regulator of acetoin/glycerol metabolism